MVQDRENGGGLSMDRCRKHPISHHPGLRYASVLCAVAILNVLPGCVTTKSCSRNGLGQNRRSKNSR